MRSCAAAPIAAAILLALVRVRERGALGVEAVQEMRLLGEDRVVLRDELVADLEKDKGSRKRRRKKAKMKKRKVSVGKKEKEKGLKGERKRGADSFSQRSGDERLLALRAANGQRENAERLRRARQRFLLFQCFCPDDDQAAAVVFRSFVLSLSRSTF